MHHAALPGAHTAAVEPRRAPSTSDGSGSAPTTAHDRRSRGRRMLVGGAGVVTAVTALVLAGTPAFAHVRVSPSSAPAGSYATLTFTVPTESDTASTTGLEIQLPVDHPLASVLARPVPGWTVQTTTTHLSTPLTTDDGQVSDVVTDVRWTGGQIPPGQFDQFSLSVGPLPSNPGPLTFKALQSYSDGTVVRWIDVGQPGGQEPAHPAPTLTITPASASDAGAASAPPGSAATASSDHGADGLARGLAVGGLAVGVVALVAAAWAGLRVRRRGTP